MVMNIVIKDNNPANNMFKKARKKIKFKITLKLFKFCPYDRVV